MRKRRNHLAVLFVLTIAVSRTAGAQAVRPDLTAVTLEDLMNITITTASRTAEGANDAPARVQVVTAADVQRRGYRSLADLLKDLPDVLK
jgi:outer membrane receptor for ferrienterochelin and colicin